MHLEGSVKTVSSVSVSHYPVENLFPDAKPIVGPTSAISLAASLEVEVPLKPATCQVFKSKSFSGGLGFDYYARPGDLSLGLDSSRFENAVLDSVPPCANNFANDVAASATVAATAEAPRVGIESFLDSNLETFPLSPHRIDSFSMLTFNAGLLEVRLFGMQMYQNPSFTAKRLECIPPAIRRANTDFVAFQEVYAKEHARFLVRELQDLYPYAVRDDYLPQGEFWQFVLKDAAKPSKRQGVVMFDNGLLFLSKYPIVCAKFHPWKKVTYLESMLANKGFLEVFVDIPGVDRIAFYNIHMASASLKPESRHVEQLRTEEAKQLLQTCNETAQRGFVPIVIGDLNAAPNNCPENYFEFTNNGWTDCYVVAKRLAKALRAAPRSTHSKIFSEHVIGYNANVDASGRASEESAKRGADGKGVNDEPTSLSSGSLRDSRSQLQPLPKASIVRRKSATHALKNYAWRRFFLRRKRPLGNVDAGEHKDGHLEGGVADSAAHHDDQWQSIHYDDGGRHDADANSSSSSLVGEKYKLLYRSSLGKVFARPLVDIRRRLSMGSRYIRSKIQNRRRRVFLRHRRRIKDEDPESVTKTYKLVKSQVFRVPIAKKRHGRQATNSIGEVAADAGVLSPDSLKRQQQQPPRHDSLENLFVVTPSKIPPAHKLRFKWFKSRRTTHEYTWDPENPLNKLGPHSSCHGLRCDYVFVPPAEIAGNLRGWVPNACEILFREPTVLVNKAGPPCSCFCTMFSSFKNVMFVTLSDHYALKVVLTRHEQPRII